jgi:hypothetical protein
MRWSWCPSRLPSRGAILDKAAPEPELRRHLEDDPGALTAIGNGFMIRQSEIGKVPITKSAEVDYLFHRIFAFRALLVGCALGNVGEIRCKELSRLTTIWM